MHKIFLLFAGSLLTPGVYADPPMTILNSARVYLTTTTIEEFPTYSSADAHGFVQEQVIQSTNQVIMPNLVIDGYIERSNFDPPVLFSTATKPADLATQGVVYFVAQKDIVQIKHPVDALLSTKWPAWYRIPAQDISKVEKSSGSLDGMMTYAQPFYVPKQQAELMRDETPVYSCHAQYSEVPDIYWASYDKTIGEKELDAMCSRDSSHQPSGLERDELLQNKRVFMLSIPSD